MTLEILQRAQRRIGHFPIELPAAVALAGAVAFVTMVMPDWRFESLVTATGLPGIVNAAQPPLGQTARVIVALVLAGLSFAAAWLGLRALDRRAVPTDFPAFRTADLHPDAPRRRPIRAGAEFGKPIDELPPTEEQVAKKPSEPLPSFLAPKQRDTVPEVAAPVAPVPSIDIPEPPAEPAPAGIKTPTPVEEPASDIGAAPEATTQDAAPEPLLRAKRRPIIEVGPEIASQAEPGVDTGTRAPIMPGGADDDDQASQALRDPFWEELPVRSPPRVVMPEVDTTALPQTIAPAPSVVPAEIAAPEIAAPKEDEEEESVSALMARLEIGLSRRGSKPLAVGSADGAQEELRDVLGDLDRTSGRNN